MWKAWEMSFLSAKITKELASFVKFERRFYGREPRRGEKCIFLNRRSKNNAKWNLLATISDASMTSRNRDASPGFSQSWPVVMTHDASIRGNISAKMNTGIWGTGTGGYYLGKQASLGVIRHNPLKSHGFWLKAMRH